MTRVDGFVFLGWVYRDHDVYWIMHITPNSSLEKTDVGHNDMIWTQDQFEQLRVAELTATQRMEASERRAMEEKNRRLAQEKARLREEDILRQKVWPTLQHLPWYHHHILISIQEWRPIQLGLRTFLWSPWLELCGSKPNSQDPVPAPWMWNMRVSMYSSVGLARVDGHLQHLNYFSYLCKWVVVNLMGTTSCPCFCTNSVRPKALQGKSSRTSLMKCTPRSQDKATSMILWRERYGAWKTPLFLCASCNICSTTQSTYKTLDSISFSSANIPSICVLPVTLCPMVLHFLVTILNNTGHGASAAGVGVRASVDERNAKWDWQHCPLSPCGCHHGKQEDSSSYLSLYPQVLIIINPFVTPISSTSWTFLKVLFSFISCISMKQCNW